MTKLFTIGPSQMYDEVIESRNSMVPYFRTQEFSEMMFFISDMLLNTLNADHESKVIPLTASGTGAMEATVTNCFTNKDKLLIINGGTFGKRFCQLCEKHYIPYDSVDLAFGEVLSTEHLIRYATNTYTALLVNLHETSTGQLYNIDLLSEFCKTNNMFLVVDAISTYLCDDYNVSKYNIDATIVSSQKGLCCSPGISFVVLSPRLDEYRKKQNKAIYQYFDFSDCLMDMQRGQTPYTPAVGVLLEINTMFRKIKNDGKASLLNRVKCNAEFFRNSITRLNVSIPDYPKSYALTPILFSKPIAKNCFSYLYKEKGLYVNPCGGDFGDRMLRIAHIGNLSIADHDELICGITEFLQGDIV